MKRLYIIVLIVLLITTNSACSILFGTSDDAELPIDEVEDESEDLNDIQTFQISVEDEVLYKPTLKRYQESTTVNINGEWAGDDNQPLDLLGNRSRILSTINYGSNAISRNCYYAYFDIDYDGTPELLISDENRDTGFVDVYTISEDRTVMPVFFGDFAGRAGNINNASLLITETGTYITLEIGEEISYGIFLYHVSENCTKVELSDTIWVTINDGSDPDTADQKGELKYFKGNEETTAEAFEVYKKTYLGTAVLYDWYPVQNVLDYHSPLENLHRPDKMLAPSLYMSTETLNLREDTDIATKIVYKVPKGDFVYVIGELPLNRKWVFVRGIDEKNFYYGWARMEYLEKVPSTD